MKINSLLTKKQLYFRSKKTNIAASIFVFLLACVTTASAREKNAIGTKIGNFLSSEIEITDIYKGKDLPITLFYERKLFSNISIDFEGWYLDRRGYSRTEDGTVTSVRTQLIYAPVSASFMSEFPITDLIIPYLGAGPDYWYYREKLENSDSPQEEEGMIAGYHGKVGIKFFTANKEYYKKVNLILETKYSQIDRFGKNEINFGGWSFNVGCSYLF